MGRNFSSWAPLSSSNDSFKPSFFKFDYLTLSYDETISSADDPASCFSIFHFLEEQNLDIFREIWQRAQAAPAFQAIDSRRRHFKSLNFWGRKRESQNLNFNSNGINFK